MAFVNNSPNMNLPIPEVGIEPGPQYATDVNNCLTLVDQHNHSPGYGIAVPSAGLNINADLTIQNNNLTNIRTSRYTVNAAPLALATDLACVYVAGKDLYYNDTAGNQVRLTAGGTVNATSSGISSGTASAAFSAGTLVVNQAANTPGNIEAGSILLGNNVASSPYLTLAPPTLSGAYTITLPALPASNSVVQISSVGTMSTIAITAPTVQRFTSGSGTYTTPANVMYLKIKMIGGGGAGGDGNGNAGFGGSGGNTTFGTSLLTCAGGSGGQVSGLNSGTGGSGGVGGSSTVNSPAIALISTTGASGCGTGGTIAWGWQQGAPGASTPLGGGGTTASSASAGNAIANTDAGGSGGSADNGGYCGAGGGAGGYIEAIIPSPSATYSYSVGSGGAPNVSGGMGGSGIIVIEEHYGF